MKLIRLPLTAALLFIIGCSTTNNLDKGASHQDQNITSTLDSLDQELLTFTENNLLPGIAFSIVNDQKVIFEKGYGFADLENKVPFTPQTIQPIASISKTLIGVALMKLVDLGKINLDDDINTYLPYKINNPKFPNTAITIRHLATHTSSIGDNYGENGSSYWLLESNPYSRGEIRDDMFDFIEALSKNQPISIDQHIRNTCLSEGEWYKEETFMDHAPGTKYDYSNNATTLAGRIIERASNMSLDEFTSKYIFQPLNMKNSCWDFSLANNKLLSTKYFPDSQSKPTQLFRMPKFSHSRKPAGHLITSISDMNLYLIEMIKGFKGNGQILSKASFDILLNPQLDNSHYGDRYSGEFNGKFDVGIFWGMSYEGNRMHDGGEIGVYSFMYFDPETGHGGLGMMNARINAFGDSREIIRKYEKKLSIIN